MKPRLIAKDGRTGTQASARNGRQWHGDVTQSYIVQLKLCNVLVLRWKVALIHAPQLRSATEVGLLVISND
jgi:hypothetical protein